MSQAYAVALGARLRAVRRERGMSLQQVEHASGGQWTVVAVGSWERAHRAVTVAKLAGLAEFYGVATEELLPAHSAGPAAAGGRRLTIDLQRLVALPARQAGPLARYAAAIQQLRHDHNRTVLTIREHDLHSLAVLYDLVPDNLAQTLINWGVLTADPPPRQPTAPAGSPLSPDSYRGGAGAESHTGTARGAS